MSTDRRTERWTIILTGRRQDWLLAIDARFLFPILPTTQQNMPELTAYCYQNVR